MSPSVYPEPPFHLQRDPALAGTSQDANLTRTEARHNKHPERWQWICRAAEYALGQGRRRLSIAQICEEYRGRARDPRRVHEQEIDFKLSNTDRAYFARALVDAGIVPADLIVLRSQPSRNSRPTPEQTPASVEQEREHRTPPNNTGSGA